MRKERDQRVLIGKSQEPMPIERAARDAPNIFRHGEGDIDASTTQQETILRRFNSGSERGHLREGISRPFYAMGMPRPEERKTERNPSG